MAEEPTAAEAGTEELVAPPVEEAKPEEQQPLTVEEIAAKAGWSPKDQFKGDPEKWKPADEYLIYGKGAVKKLGRELEGLREQTQRMTQASEAVIRQQLADNDAKWQTKMQEAFEAGDAKAFDEAQQGRAKLHEQAVPLNEPPPPVRDFTERNSTWFQRDPMATQYAIQVCEMNRHLSQEKQLEIAEAEVKKRFPEHFPQTQTNGGKPSPQVNTGASRSTVRSSGKRGFADMPKEAQDAALAFEKNHGVAKDAYAENYFKRIER